jgi:hypothetical protein
VYKIQLRSAVGFLAGSAEENKKPSVPKKARRALRKNFSGNSTSSLAVFYVEQVALNRHVYTIALKARPLFVTYFNAARQEVQELLHPHS